jgi:hypothetical protein
MYAGFTSDGIRVEQTISMIRNERAVDFQETVSISSRLAPRTPRLVGPGALSVSLCGFKWIPS